MGPEEPEQNITHMDASLYKAAVEGNIEEFNNKQGPQLESLKTPNHDNVLHLNLATQENATLLFNIFLSIIKFFPVLYGCFSPPMRDLITIIRGEKRSDFIEQILSKCPSMLLQTNAKGQTPLHVAARYGHSAIVKLLIKSCAKARDGDLEKLGMDEVNAVRGMLRIRDQESNTALHEAARCGNVEVVKALSEFEEPDFPYSANKKQETPLYIAARRGDGGMLSILLDKSKSTAHGGPHGRTALHAAAMAGDAGSSIFKRGGAEIVYGSVRNLMELEGAFGITPQEAHNTLRSKKQHQKQKQIKELLEELENDQVAEEPVRHFRLPNVSTERLEAIRNTHLIVAALIATVTFAAAITVPGGLESEKGSKQGTPFLIHEAAFKVFVVTNALAFIFSVSALFIYFGVLDILLSRFKFWRQTVLYRTRSVSGLLGYATLAMMIAFSTGSYVVLKPSHGLAIVSYLICPAFFFVLHLTIFDYYITKILFHR
ncbi:hypothetical protein ES319_D04G215000v1 [Gossypium barbadense]|uniref:PGG domain-containing protein n=1 Tax=Gossypium barbadense TaxID=3634 RepID=A0A5J5RYD4_GOSBA|nr:hypothetical protein ES319_D04G215000v1 [Gossypium barbadense]